MTDYLTRTRIGIAEQRVALLHRGQTFVPPQIVAKLVDRLNGDELTERELAVLRSLATGQSNKAIAQTLFISEATVKAHLSSTSSTY